MGICIADGGQRCGSWKSDCLNGGQEQIGKIFKKIVLSNDELAKRNTEKVLLGKRNL